MDLWKKLKSRPPREYFFALVACLGIAQFARLEYQKSQIKAVSSTGSGGGGKYRKVDAVAQAGQQLDQRGGMPVSEVKFKRSSSSSPSE